MDETLIRFVHSTNSASAAIGATAGSATVGKSLLLYAGGGTQKVRIGADGSVTMGTGSPESRLTLYSMVEGQLIRFARSSDSVTAGIGATVGDELGAGKALIFYTNDQARVRINQSGNVGIGTATITARLHVEGGEIVSKGNPQVGEGRVSAREFFRVTSSDGRSPVVDSDGKVFGAVYG